VRPLGGNVVLKAVGSFSLLIGHALGMLGTKVVTAKPPMHVVPSSPVSLPAARFFQSVTSQKQVRLDA
jgi:hypothetical protein